MVTQKNSTVECPGNLPMQQIVLLRLESPVSLKLTNLFSLLTLGTNES